MQLEKCIDTILCSSEEEGHFALVSFHRGSELKQMKMLVLASSYSLEISTHSCKQFEGAFRIRECVHLPARMIQKPYRYGHGCREQEHRHIIWSCYHFCAALNILQHGCYSVGLLGPFSLRTTNSCLTQLVSYIYIYDIACLIWSILTHCMLNEKRHSVSEPY